MDEKIAKLIKENKGILRQLTCLNSELKELKGKVKALEQRESYYPNKAELKKMPLFEGTD